MKKTQAPKDASVTMDGLSVLLTALLGAANLTHLLFTIWLITEQIETGWGYGTNIEMMALLPWMIEALAMPVLLGTLIYEIAAWRRQYRSRLRRAVTMLTAVALLQFLLTNLFMFC